MKVITKIRISKQIKASKTIKILRRQLMFTICAKSTKSLEPYQRRNSVTQNPFATNKECFLFRKQSNCRDGKDIMKKFFKRIK